MRVTVEIANPVDRSRAVTLDNVLVDTGAARTTIPRYLAQQLGLEILGNLDVRTPSGVERLDRSYARVRLQERESFNDIWINDTYPDVLLGVVTLEAMALGVDPKNERLIDVEQLLL